MKQREKAFRGVPRPDRIAGYFRLEAGPLAAVTVSGLLYNVGMAAGPYFEGQLAQCLYDVLNGNKMPADMVRLAVLYLAVIFFVQLMRAAKRFGVRRFANDTSRVMRRMLYNSLVHSSREELQSRGLGDTMTRAVADVDACVEGMRKFTTEVFDTGVVMVVYAVLLFGYDWRLALLACAFTPAAYFIAGRLKGRVAKSSAAYKASAGRLNGSTMDLVSNALLYRVYGAGADRRRAYEGRLTDYEKKAVAANLWENTLQPIYNIIAMCGVVPILYFGARNVLGTGWTAWNIAAFTTFLSCFAKLALKASKAAKLFNAVQKAQVSWGRVKPLMRPFVPPEIPADTAWAAPVSLRLEDVSVGWPGGAPVLTGINMEARAGQIIGITGPVACGKSTLARALLGEGVRTGRISVSGRSLDGLAEPARRALFGYLGHDPELLADTLAENIRLGVPGSLEPVLQAVCLSREVEAMPQGENTELGAGGVRLSGGQAQRAALARTLYHARPILVLDDPFSAVDTATERQILQNLRALCGGCIVLLISHRLGAFPGLDGVLYLENGHGTFSTHAGLMRQAPGYAALYEHQQKGGAEHEKV